MTDNPAMFSMTPEALEAFMEVRLCVGEEIVEFVAKLQRNGTPSALVCDEAIPDDAPEQIKNRLAMGNGKNYSVAFGNIHHATFLQWYQTSSGELIILWNVEHPVDVTLKE